MSDKTYAGSTSDILLSIREAAKLMSEHSLREVEFQLRFSDGLTEIRIKR